MSWKTKLPQTIKERNVLLYRWQGVIFNEQDVYSRLDKTYLYVIRPDNILQRIVGYTSFNEFGESVIRYTSDALYRIVTGKRRGRVVPAHKIGAAERFETATLFKQMATGNNPEFLNPNARGDSHIISLLEDCEDIQDTSEFRIPGFHICTRQESPVLYARQSGEAVSYITSFNKYNVSKPIEDNLKTLLPEMATDAGEGRKAYPFEYVYGKGVLAVDHSASGGWYAIPLDALKQPIQKGPVTITLKIDAS